MFYTQKASAEVTQDLSLSPDDWVKSTKDTALEASGPFEGKRKIQQEYEGNFFSLSTLLFFLLLTS